MKKPPKAAQQHANMHVAAPALPAATPAILPQTGGIFIREGTTLTQVQGAVEAPFNATEKDV